MAKTATTTNTKVKQGERVYFTEHDDEPTSHERGPWDDGEDNDTHAIWQ